MRRWFLQAKPNKPAAPGVSSPRMPPADRHGIVAAVGPRLPVPVHVLPRGGQHVELRLVVVTLPLGGTHYLPAPSLQSRFATRSNGLAPMPVARHVHSTDTTASVVRLSTPDAYRRDTHRQDRDGHAKKSRPGGPPTCDGPPRSRGDRLLRRVAHPRDQQKPIRPIWDPQTLADAVFSPTIQARRFAAQPMIAVGSSAAAL